MDQFEKKRLNRAFLHAVWKGLLPEAKDLLGRGASINGRDDENFTALMYAVQKSDMEMFDFILSQNPDVNAANRYGATPLYLAACQKNPQMVKALLDRGADVRVTLNGFTVFSHAMDCPPLLETLINSGIDVNTPGDKGVTPLMKAVKLHRIAGVKALIAAGAKLDLQDAAGATALIHAVNMTESWPLVRALVEAGADLHLKDDREKSPADYAADNGLHDIEKYLRETAMEKELSIFKNGLPYPIKATKPFRVKP